MQIENEREKLVEKPAIIIAGYLIMLFSMYIAYSKTLSVLYQIAIAVFCLVTCKGSIYVIIPMLLLTTTRSYIAVSTQSNFQNYLGLNGFMLTSVILGTVSIRIYKNKFRIDKESIYIALFAILMLLSKVWAKNATEYGSNYIAICLIYLFYPMLIDSEKAILINRISFASAGMFLAIGMIPHIVNKGTMYEWFVQADRNYQSCFILICMLQVLVLLNQYWKKLPKLVIFLCILVIAADMFVILTSASRSAFIAIIIAIVINLLLNFTHGKKLVFFSIFVATGIYFFYTNGLFGFILERFSLSNVSTGNGRLMIWKTYMESFWQGNPLQIVFGRGLVGQTDFGSVAHNIFISVLYCYGVVGLILLSISLIYCVVVFLKNKHTEELVILIPILFMCCTIEPYYRLEFAFYLASLMGTANYYLRRHKNEF